MNINNHKTKWINSTLTCLFFFSLCWIVVFDIISVDSGPIKIFLIKMIGRIIKVISYFTYAFVSAYIFWYLTVFIKQRNKRQLQSWWIHDQLTLFNESIRGIELNLGQRESISREAIIGEYVNNSQKDINLSNLRSIIKQIDDMSFKLLNLSLEWDEIEYDLFGQIHNCCHEILRLTQYQLIDVDELELNLKKLLTLSEQIDEKASQTVIDS